MLFRLPLYRVFRDAAAVPVDRQVIHYLGPNYLDRSYLPNTSREGERALVDHHQQPVRPQLGRERQPFVHVEHPVEPRPLAWREQRLPPRHARSLGRRRRRGRGRRAAAAAGARRRPPRRRRPQSRWRTRRARASGRRLSRRGAGASRVEDRRIRPTRPLARPRRHERVRGPAVDQRGGRVRVGLGGVAVGGAGRVPRRARPPVPTTPAPCGRTTNEAGRGPSSSPSVGQWRRSERETGGPKPKPRSCSSGTRTTVGDAAVGSPT